jgi:hypothetical protein
MRQGSGERSTYRSSSRVEEGGSTEHREEGEVRQEEIHALTGVLVSIYRALTFVGPTPKELFMKVYYLSYVFCHACICFCIDVLHDFSHGYHPRIHLTYTHTLFGYN